MHISIYIDMNFLLVLLGMVLSALAGAAITSLVIEIFETRAELKLLADFERQQAKVDAELDQLEAEADADEARLRDALATFKSAFS